MAKLDNDQISMLKMVIEAAREGRYLHGNGATWVILKKGSSSVVVVVDHVAKKVSNMNATESANYLRSNRPHRDDSVVKSLENFIK
jgi:hypothetical protein